MHIQLLDGIPMFAGLTGDEKWALAREIRVRDLPARETLFWMGDTGDDFYVISAGKVAILYPDGDGKEITLAILGPGDFFGEVALLDGGTRTATARPITDVSLLCLSGTAFHSFLRGSPAAALHVIQMLGRRQRESLDKLRGIKNLNEVMEERTTAWQRVAHTIATIAAGRNFLLFHAAAAVFWVILNVATGKHAPDPFPFPFLCLWCSCEAIFLSLFILISQDFQGRKDRMRTTELEYQVAVKGQVDIMQLHRKLDGLTELLSERVEASATPSFEPAAEADTPDAKDEACESSAPM